MKAGDPNRLADFPRQDCLAQHEVLAFTLIELLVVMGVIAMLAALLIPTMAGARGDTARAECQINMKQLGIGFRLFEQDHDEMFPPAAFAGGAFPSQLTWDVYLHRYIGGKLADADLGWGVLDPGVTPGVLICPAAPDRVIDWAQVGGVELFGRRTYAMVGSIPYLQVSPSATTPPYRLTQAPLLGVGIYWQDSTVPADWDAKSFKTSVVKDPGGTLLLVEQSENMNVAGNIWPSVSLGVADVQWGGRMLCQINSAALLPPQGASSAQGLGLVNMGKFLYQNHGFRFNYLFHDGHVETLATNQTIGKALGASTNALKSPLGMWTVKLGD